MKKVLLASTALVAFAGAAAAEIAITGSAEMGVVGGGVNAANGSGGEVQFWNDLDVKFTMTGESDSGLSFGAVVDLDEAGNLGNPFRNQGTSVFISGAFGTLTLGDTDGAIDWAITDAGDIGNPGSLDDAETTHAGYNGSFGDGAFDDQVLRYDYSFGDIGVAISYEQGAEGDPVAVPGSVLGQVLPGAPDGTIALGLRYGLDLGGTTVNLGAGVSRTDFIGDERQIWALGASASLGGGFSAGVTYQDWDFDVAEDVSHVGVGLGFETGPISVHANWGEYDFAASDDVAGWGVAAAYDLGGGLSAHLGYSDSDLPDAEQWSLGMSMAF